MPTETIETYDADGNLIATEVVEITPDEQLAREHSESSRPFTTDEYNAVRTQMQVLRDLRQMGRQAFMGLTAAERDRLMYDAFTAITRVLLAILRDPDG